jgi:HlyD family secretion protein
VIEQAQSTSPSPSSTPDPDVLAVLNPPGNRKRWGLLAALAGGLTLIGVLALSSGDKTSWETATVTEATLVEEVTAVGQLEPLHSVEIGSDLSGEILEVLVDTNDMVIAGQALARLEPMDFDNNVKSKEAQRVSARASLDQAVVGRTSAELTLKRTRTLKERGAATGVELENAELNLDTTTAQVNAARAQLTLASVALDQARQDLVNTTITAPIDGVVTRRLVEPGQTVISSMSVTPLFEIASDPTALKAEVGVEEADVGQVKAGQVATFTVPAWPDRVFQAEVSSIDLASDATSTIVTYTTELSIDNADGALRPGMTATAAIEIGRREGLMHVPAEALRFRPDGDEDVLDDRIYVLIDGEPAAVPVDVLGSTGMQTAIASDQLTAGAQVVTGAVQ